MIFLENRNFFEPYPNFNQNVNVPPAYIPSMPMQTPTNDYLGPAITPKEFYEQQSVYYRYLTTMMEYNIKSREYERLMHQDNKRNNP